MDSIAARNDVGASRRRDARGLANAGVPISRDALSGRGQLVAAIVVGVAVGKPVGVELAAILAVCAGVAVKLRSTPGASSSAPGRWLASV